jgi:hypothetical protein
MQLQGVGMRHFLAMIQAFCEQHMADAEMIEFVLPLAEVAKQWGELTMLVGKKAVSNPEEIGAASVDYLFYSGYVVLAYYWALSVSKSTESVAKTKRDTAKFYFARILPRINGHASAIKSGAASIAEIA